MESVSLGHLLALLTAFCWAENSVIWGCLSNRTDSVATAHLRMWIALPAIILVAYLREGAVSISITNQLILLLSGSLGYFVTDLLMFHAYQTLGPQKSMAIMTLNPALTAIFSWLLFHQSLTVIQIVGLCLTLLGVVVLTFSVSKIARTGKRGELRTGVLCAVLGALFQSVSFLLSKQALDVVPPFSANMVRTIGGTASLFLYSLFKGKLHHDLTSYRHVEGKYLFLLFLGSLLGPLLGMSAEMKAFTLAPLGTVTAITQASPVILLIQAKVFSSERITTTSIAATMISMLGIVLLFVSL